MTLFFLFFFIIGEALLVAFINSNLHVFALFVKGGTRWLHSLHWPMPSEPTHTTDMEHDEMAFRFISLTKQFLAFLSGEAISPLSDGLMS